MKATPIQETLNVIDEIQARDDLFMARFNVQDAAGVAALYAPDAMVFPPNADALTGRDAIAAMWQSAFAMGISSGSLTAREAFATGQFAYEHGVYEMFVGEDKFDWGKFMVVWKKINGDWYLFRDIWNSSRPAA